MPGSATRKQCLSRCSLVLGIESRREVNDHSCLGMLNWCRRLASRVVDVLEMQDV